MIKQLILSLIILLSLTVCSYTEDSGKIVYGPIEIKFKTEKNSINLTEKSIAYKEAFTL